MNANNNGDGEWEKGLLWKLPELRIKNVGKVGPSFAVGIGCGVGFGFGLIGGAGIGPGIPGLQLGFGLGAGCGVGAGFGYGVGRGTAYDENAKYSNISRNSYGLSLPSQDDLGAVVEEFVARSRKLMRATSKEIEKLKKR